MPTTRSLPVASRNGGFGYLALAFLLAFLVVGGLTFALHARDAHGAARTTSSLTCQAEENGEVIGYPAGMAVRPGFRKIACPK